MTGPTYPGYGEQPSTGPMAGYTPGTVGRINPGLRMGVAGTVLSIIGGVLVVVALSGLGWLSVTATDRTYSFGDLHDLVRAFGGSASQPSDAYFSWLAWTVLIVAVLVSLLANAPMGASAALRPLGFLLGITGAALTFWALKFNSQSNYSDTLSHARIGFWFAVIGFLLLGVGAVLGPRRL